MRLETREIHEVVLGKTAGKTSWRMVIINIPSVKRVTEVHDLDPEAKEPAIAEELDAAILEDEVADLVCGLRVAEEEEACPLVLREVEPGPVPVCPFGRFARIISIPTKCNHLSFPSRLSSHRNVVSSPPL